MPTRKGHAIWEGNLKDGNGKIDTGSDAIKEQYSFKSRFEGGEGTNPEELIGAAHAGCYSMALANALAEAGHNPTRVDTNAAVELEKSGDGFAISSITLNTEASIEGIDEDTFMQHAETAKKNCPVSKALQGTEIKLNAKLVKE